MDLGVLLIYLELLLHFLSPPFLSYSCLTARTECGISLRDTVLLLKMFLVNGMRGIFFLSQAYKIELLSDLISRAR